MFRPSLDLFAPIISVLIVPEAEFSGAILLAALDEVFISMFSTYVSDSQVS